MLTFAFMDHPYLVCILFGMPSLHLFTFLMFFLFSCIYIYIYIYIYMCVCVSIVENNSCIEKKKKQVKIMGIKE